MNLYFDVQFGAAGDMLLAALVAAGAEPSRLLADLKTLPIDDWELKFSPELRCGISAITAKVIERSHKPHHHEKSENLHAAIEKPHHHGLHHKSPTHYPKMPAAHHGRKLGDFLALLAGAKFSAAVKARAEKVWRLLAEVEGKIHGKSPEEVHFHEISGIDTLIDVCGVCLAIDYLGIEKISASPLQVGGGMVNCAHGIMSVPTPATLAILEKYQIPFAAGLANQELLTPTGAALLAILCAEFAPSSTTTLMKIIRSGYGAGQANFSTHANVVRAVLYAGDSAANNGAVIATQDKINFDKILEFRAAMDDLTGEQLGFLFEQLSAVALEVYWLPAVMKKNRAGGELVILGAGERRAAIREIIFTNGATLGFRVREVEREILPREFKTVEVFNTPVRVKCGTFRGKPTFIKPEYDDCRQVALAQQVSINEVQKLADAQIMRALP